MNEYAEPTHGQCCHHYKQQEPITSMFILIQQFIINAQSHATVQYSIHTSYSVCAQVQRYCRFLYWSHYFKQSSSINNSLVQKPGPSKFFCKVFMASKTLYNQILFQRNNLNFQKNRVMLQCRTTRIVIGNKVLQDNKPMFGVCVRILISGHKLPSPTSEVCLFSTAFAYNAGYYY